MAKDKFKAANKRAEKGTARKRVRTDVFNPRKPEESSKFFDGIVLGRNALYAISFKASVKRDYYNRERHCWRVYRKADSTWVNNLRSAKAYRFSVLWSVYDGKQFWRPKQRDKKVQSILIDLPRIEGKQGDHSRHKCGNDWCCNPGHIQIGSRTANEIDKHFHYFLNHQDPDVREAFRASMGELCSKHRLF